MKGKARFRPFRDSVNLGDMVLLGDLGEVEARFSPFGDSVNLDAR